MSEFTRAKCEGLKPCPFCEATYISLRDDSECQKKFPFYAECQNCGARSGVCDSPETVFELWNSRSSEGWRADDE